MTDFAVYIGRMDDPEFKWDGGDWNNNVPKAITPRFPDSSLMFSKIIRSIRNGEMPGKQTDFGGWVVPMSLGDVVQYVNSAYAPDAYDPESKSIYEQQNFAALKKLWEAIEKLDSETDYALVAWEL